MTDLTTRCEAAGAGEQDSALVESERACAMALESATGDGAWECVARDAAASINRLCNALEAAAARHMARGVLPIIHRLTTEGHDAGVAEERARVVRWLRPYPSVIGLSEMAAWNTAALIERGEHVASGDG